MISATSASLTFSNGAMPVVLAPAAGGCERSAGDEREQARGTLGLAWCAPRSYDALVERAEARSEPLDRERRRRLHRVEQRLQIDQRERCPADRDGIRADD